ncbi:hypothetical protein AB0C38_21610 [Amycolatopsis sp. NPDC048633]|uniref:hypothetical protein n=1 Tax=Amycolatopsis sp. NPDC048633 TaxID=3157095 RepID=UPI0033DB2E89
MPEPRRADWLALGEQYPKIDSLLHPANADHVVASAHQISAGTADGVTGVLFGLVRMSMAQYSADCDAREQAGAQRRRVRLEPTDELFSGDLPFTCPPTIGEPEQPES